MVKDINYSPCTNEITESFPCETMEKDLKIRSIVRTFKVLCGEKNGGKRTQKKSSQMYLDRLICFHLHRMNYTEAILFHTGLFIF